MTTQRHTFRPFMPPQMVTHRPGAERAADLPSRENGILVPPKKPGHMCVSKPLQFATRF